MAPDALCEGGAPDVFRSQPGKAIGQQSTLLALAAEVPFARACKEAAALQGRAPGLAGA